MTARSTRSIPLPRSATKPPMFAQNENDWEIEYRAELQEKQKFRVTDLQTLANADFLKQLGDDKDGEATTERALDKYMQELAKIKQLMMDEEDAAVDAERTRRLLQLPVGEAAVKGAPEDRTLNYYHRTSRLPPIASHTSAAVHAKLNDDKIVSENDSDTESYIQEAADQYHAKHVPLKYVHPNTQSETLRPSATPRTSTSGSLGRYYSFWTPQSPGTPSPGTGQRVQTQRVLSVPAKEREAAALSLRNVKKSWASHGQAHTEQSSVPSLPLNTSQPTIRTELQSRHLSIDTAYARLSQLEGTSASGPSAKPMMVSSARKNILGDSVADRKNDNKRGQRQEQDRRRREKTPETEQETILQEEMHRKHLEVAARKSAEEEARRRIAEQEEALRSYAWMRKQELARKREEVFDRADSPMTSWGGSRSSLVSSPSPATSNSSSSSRSASQLGGASSARLSPTPNMNLILNEDGSSPASSSVANASSPPMLSENEFRRNELDNKLYEQSLHWQTPNAERPSHELYQEEHYIAVAQASSRGNAYLIHPLIILNNIFLRRASRFN